MSSIAQTLLLCSLSRDFSPRGQCTGFSGLFLGFLPFGGGACGGGEFALGHCACEATDVVLEEFVFAFEFVVVGFDLVDAFCERLEGGLQGFCLSREKLA